MSFQFSLLDPPSNFQGLQGWLLQSVVCFAWVPGKVTLAKHDSEMPRI